MAMNLGEIDNRATAWRQRFSDSEQGARQRIVDENTRPAESEDLTPHSNEYVALQPGEMLFAAGAPRTAFFRVETGTLAVVVGEATDDPTAYCLLEAGAYLGLGFQDVYLISAYAVDDATVAQFDNGELTTYMASSPSLSTAYADAVRREFEILRAYHTRELDELSPLQKVARVLIALEDTAERQGSTLRAVSDLLDSHYIADLVGLSIAELTECLRFLHNQGYLRSTIADDLEIADVEGLHALSQDPNHGADFDNWSAER